MKLPFRRPPRSVEERKQELLRRLREIDAHIALIQRDVPRITELAGEQ